MLEGSLPWEVLAAQRLQFVSSGFWWFLSFLQSQKTPSYLPCGAGLGASVSGSLSESVLHSELSLDLFSWTPLPHPHSQPCPALDACMALGRQISQNWRRDARSMDPEKRLSFR